jgi:hypothetical protein
VQVCKPFGLGDQSVDNCDENTPERRKLLRVAEHLFTLYRIVEQFCQPRGRGDKLNADAHERRSGTEATSIDVE